MIKNIPIRIELDIAVYYKWTVFALFFNFITTQNALGQSQLNIVTDSFTHTELCKLNCQTYSNVHLTGHDRVDDLGGSAGQLKHLPHRGSEL